MCHNVTSRNNKREVMVVSTTKKNKEKAPLNLLGRNPSFVTSFNHLGDQFTEEGDDGGGCQTEEGRAHQEVMELKEKVSFAHPREFLNT